MNGDPAADFDKLARNRQKFIDAVRTGTFLRLKWIKFKVIDGCNIKCVMCNHWRRDEYLRSFLTTDRLMKLGEELAELGTEMVSWSGGEPTLRRDLPEIIGRYRELGIASTMVSNGTRMTEEFAGRLVQAGLEEVALSIESSDPATHDKVVGQEGAWQKLTDGVRHLRRDHGAMPEIIFTTVLSSINMNRDLIGLVPLAASLDVKRIRMDPVYVGHLTDAERALLPAPEQIARFENEVLPAMLEQGKRLGIPVSVDGLDRDDAGMTGEAQPARISADGNHSRGYYETHTCYLPWYHCTVNWAGDVMACCHIGGEGILGNIKTTSLIDVLHSEQARDFRLSLTSAATLPKSCKECVMSISMNRQIDRVLYGDE